MDTTQPTLLLRIRDRSDTDAWTTFDEIYRPMLYRFAIAQQLSPADAEDVVQHCMNAISEHIGSFEYDPARGRFKSWLRTLVNNRVRNLLRKRTERPADSTVMAATASPQRTPDEIFEDLWDQQHLWHCLRAIREEVEDTTFRAFQMYVIEQRPVQTVCAEFDLTPANLYTIKWRLTDKIAARMRELLGEEDQA